MRITITQTSGNTGKGEAFYADRDAHAREFAVSINGVRCGLITHSNNPKLPRGHWEAHICGRRIAAVPQLNRIRGEVRRALRDEATLQRVLDGASERVERALMLGEDDQFERFAKVRRIVAAAIRDLAEK